MENTVKSFLNQKSFVIAGSFRNETKYAYRILKKLKDKGYTVYPVNPGIKEVDRIKCYANVNDIQEEVDVANLVTPPAVTEKIVVDCKKKGIKKIWLQPGAESQKAIRFCKENNMEIVYGICVLIEAT